MSAPVPDRILKVRVPASTSNLGPGFDCLGLALDLFLDVTLRGPISGGAHRRELLILDDATWPDLASDLLMRAFERACSRFGVAEQFWDWQIESDIPIGRGLGSSGAAVAAGIRLAAFLAVQPPSLAQELALGVELEGHPDNVTASLIGGATLCVPIPNEEPAYTPLELAPDLAFALAWPTQSLETSAARRVLPAAVPFGDAVENARRLGLLLAGLRTADSRLLALGSSDRLHERYRLALIPGAEAALRAARENGAWLANLSGSGSALIAISAPSRVGAVCGAMRAALEHARPGAVAREARAVFEGATVRDLTRAAP